MKVCGKLPSNINRVTLPHTQTQKKKKLKVFLGYERTISSCKLQFNLIHKSVYEMSKMYNYGKWCYYKMHWLHPPPTHTDQIFTKGEVTVSSNFWPVLSDCMKSMSVSKA